MVSEDSWRRRGELHPRPVTQAEPTSVPRFGLDKKALRSQASGGPGRG